MKKIIFLISIFMLSAIQINFAGEFKQSGEYYRYFEDDGTVAYDKIIEIDRKKYYVNNDGYLVFSSWVNKDDKFYYAGNDGVFYTSGIFDIEEYKYYIDENGEMQKGWIDDYMYYADEEDGFLLSGFQELIIPKDMATEVDNEKTAWFYFDTVSFKKYYAEDDPYVCKSVGVSKYCFDQNGIIRTGWRQIKETEPVMKGYMYFQSETTDEFKYGEAITDSWYTVEPPAEVLPSAEIRYFYFNGQGQPRCAKEGSFQKARLNEKTYLFNEYGFAIYGVHNIDGDYYYFGNSVENCSMKVGFFNEDVDESGDGASYYFEESGRGFTGVYKNKLYYKGKLQMAGKEQKYAGITVGNITRLVNANGVIMKNKRKIKDGDDCEWSTNSGGVVTYSEEGATFLDPIPPYTSNSY